MQPETRKQKTRISRVLRGNEIDLREHFQRALGDIGKVADGGRNEV